MHFEQIYYSNITSYRGGGGSHGSGGDTTAVINLDCDDHYNGKNNCDVTLLDVVHLQPHGTPTMFCKGVRGTAEGLIGVKSCLKSDL